MGETITWIPTCPNLDCRFVMKPVVMDLDEALQVPTHCPRCVTHLYTNEVTDMIYKRFSPHG